LRPIFENSQREETRATPYGKERGSNERITSHTHPDPEEFEGGRAATMPKTDNLIVRAADPHCGINGTQATSLSPERERARQGSGGGGGSTKVISTGGWKREPTKEVQKKLTWIQFGGTVIEERSLVRTRSRGVGGSSSKETAYKN